MDRVAIKNWLSGLAPAEKAIFLMSVMHGLTLTVRWLFYDKEHPCEERIRLMYKISEMNHRFTAAAWQVLESKPTYPDDVLIEILLDHPDCPELEASCWDVLEHSIRSLPNNS